MDWLEVCQRYGSKLSSGVLWGEMKPAPAPHVPGNTEAERFDSAVRKMFTVSKEAVLKAEAKWKLARERKKRAKKTV
jgi:hypothetical protein